jgi:hypothetical protein
MKKLILFTFPFFRGIMPGDLARYLERRRTSKINDNGESIMTTNRHCTIHRESSLSIGQGRRVNGYRPSAICFHNGTDECQCHIETRELRRDT